MKTLGKLAILPSIFNINEPLIFGVPIVLNPVSNYTILFGVQTINGILTYIIMKLDIIGKTYTYVPWTTPAPIGGALATMSILAFFWILLLIVRYILMAPILRTKTVIRRLLKMKSNKKTLWGAATALASGKGAVTADGKGQTSWDLYYEKNDLGYDGDIAVDHYHKMKRRPVKLSMKLVLKPMGSRCLGLAFFLMEMVKSTKKVWIFIMTLLMNY